MMIAHEHQEAERRFVEHLRTRFEDEGFTFEPYPDVARLPDFMASYRPDAIARKGDRNVAIEVKNRQNPEPEHSLTGIRRLFEGHSDWQLRIIFMGGDPHDAVTVATSTPALIRARLAEARGLLDQGQRRAAFLAAWSVLEAACRRASEALNGKPATPGTVVQTLAMEGRITPETEREMRALIGLRNKVVHGDLAAEPTDHHVGLVLSTAGSVMTAWDEMKDEGAGRT